MVWPCLGVLEHVDMGVKWCGFAHKNLISYKQAKVSQKKKKKEKRKEMRIEEKKANLYICMVLTINKYFGGYVPEEVTTSRD